MKNFFKKTEYKGWQKQETYSRGSAMLISVIFFLFISIAIIAGLVAPSVREFRVSSNFLSSRQSFFLSESGIEDAYYRLKTSKTIGTSESISLSGNTVTTAIVDLGSDQKTITSVGDVSLRQRKNEITVTTGAGFSFHYGMQIGQGGITMDNNAGVVGNVYANGNIIGANGAYITGTAVAANRSAQILDQENGTDAPANSISVGNASSTQDAGQSFKTNATDAITQISLHIKKTGNPGNLTLRITSDSSGKPASSSLATGTLSASQVTSSYGWVTISLSSSPTLTAGTTYWVVLDGSTSSSNFYSWGANMSYAVGQAKSGSYGGTWNNTSPSGLDGYFRVYLGGIPSTINNVDIGTNSADLAWARTVTNSDVEGIIYCETGSGNNKSCDTSRDDPPPQDMPISDAQISEWKDSALDGGTYNGNYILTNSAVGTLGPKKIIGNLSLDNGSTLTITGSLWVTGTIMLSNNSTIRLASSFGSSSGMIIADGIVKIDNNGVFAGSGTTGSYIMVLTTSTSTSAIEVSNNAGTVLLVAQNGTIKLDNNSGAKSVVAKEVHISNNGLVNYESGIADLNFSTGPSGSWSISEWKEVK